MKKAFFVLIALLLTLCMCACDQSAGAPETTECSFKDATCTAPKTCTYCGATEGEALGHDYQGKTCSRCQAEDPDYHELTEGQWCFTAKHTDGELYKYVIEFVEGFCNVTVEVYQKEDWGQWGDRYDYNGQTWWRCTTYWAVNSPSFPVAVDGKTVTIEAEGDFEQKCIIVLEKTAGNQMTVKSVSNNTLIYRDALGQYIPAGTVFAWEKAE